MTHLGKKTFSCALKDFPDPQSLERSTKLEFRRDSRPERPGAGGKRPSAPSGRTLSGRGQVKHQKSLHSSEADVQGTQNGGFGGPKGAPEGTLGAATVRGPGGTLVDCGKEDRRGTHCLLAWRRAMQGAPGGFGGPRGASARGFGARHRCKVGSVRCGL